MMSYDFLGFLMIFLLNWLKVIRKVWHQPTLLLPGDRWAAGTTARTCGLPRAWPASASVSPPQSRTQAALRAGV